VFVWLLSGAQLVSWGTLFYAFTLYVAPMERDLGWTRPELNGALSLGLLASGVLAPAAGAWIDRRGGRALLSLGSLTGGLLLVAWSFTGNLAVFYATWLLIGATLAATLYEPAFAVLTHAFPRDYRRAITLMTLVGGLASTAFIPLTQLLIDVLGWRHSLLILGAFNLSYCLAVHWLLIPGGWRPGAVEVTATTPRASDTMPAQARPVRRALRSPVFWALAASFTAYSLLVTGLIFHFVPMLKEGGASTGTIVAGYAMIGPMQVAGRVGFLAFGPRATARASGGIIVLGLPISVAILIALPPTLGTLALFATLYGSANGIMTIVRGTILQEVLGPEGIGTVGGLLSLPGTFARAGAPLAVAWLWKTSGGYGPSLWAAFGCGLAAAAAFWLALVLARGAPARN
jgi:MFS family permease